MLLHTRSAGGQQASTVVSFHDQAKLTGNGGTGRVRLETHNSTTDQDASGYEFVVATFMGTGGVFTVRRIAA